MGCQPSAMAEVLREKHEQRALPVIIHADSVRGRAGGALHPPLRIFLSKVFRPRKVTFRRVSSSSVCSDETGDEASGVRSVQVKGREKKRQRMRAAWIAAAAFCKRVPTRRCLKP